MTTMKKISRETPLIGVIGGNTCRPEVARQAEEAGREIARRGGIVVCGGLGGVMRSACKGAKERNGVTIGILPGNSREDGNQFVDIPLVTGMGAARNIIIARTVHGAIAIDGKYGTLTEIAFCLEFGKPVIGLGTWDIDPSIQQASNAKEAVEWLFKRLKI